MSLPDRGIVRGNWNLLNFDQYVGNVRVTRKTVLDVGCASGYLSFEAENSGAQEVFSFDAEHMSQVFNLPFNDNLYFRDRDAWDRQEEWGLEMLKNSYRYAHAALKSNCRPVYGDIFRLYRSVPPVDVVIAGATLEHLNDPLSTIGSMARVTKETLIVAFTPVLDTEELLREAYSAADRPCAYDNLVGLLAGPVQADSRECRVLRRENRAFCSGL